jgi:hypothetical protein
MEKVNVKQSNGVESTATFMGWGIASDEIIDSGIFTYTVAIVKYANGSVDLVKVDRLKFVNS